MHEKCNHHDNGHHDHTGTQSVKCRRGEESSGSKEEAEEELPFATFGETVSSFQVVRRNWYSSFNMTNQQSQNTP